MKDLTQKQKEMVHHFFHERWGQYSVIENDNAFDLIAENLYEKFITLTLESRKLQNMSKIFIAISLIFGFLGWYYKSWVVALTLFGVIFVISFIIGGIRSSKLVKCFDWTPAELNAAMSLVTDPAWRDEMKHM